MTQRLDFNKSVTEMTQRLDFNKSVTEMTQRLDFNKSVTEMTQTTQTPSVYNLLSTCSLLYNGNT
jgi:hypothetical protein